MQPGASCGSKELHTNCLKQNAEHEQVAAHVCMTLLCASALAPSPHLPQDFISGLEVSPDDVMKESHQCQLHAQEPADSSVDRPGYKGANNPV